MEIVRSFWSSLSRFPFPFSALCPVTLLFRYCLGNIVIPLERGRLMRSWSSSLWTGTRLSVRSIAEQRSDTHRIARACFWSLLWYGVSDKWRDECLFNRFDELCGQSIKTRWLHIELRGKVIDGENCPGARQSRATLERTRCRIFGTREYTALNGYGNFTSFRLGKLKDPSFILVVLSLSCHFRLPLYQAPDV